MRCLKCYTLMIKCKYIDGVVYWLCPSCGGYDGIYILLIRSEDMGGKGSGRPIKHKTEEERRQAILESKRKYNKAHREERIAYMKQWRKGRRK